MTNSLTLKLQLRFSQRPLKVTSRINVSISSLYTHMQKHHALAYTVAKKIVGTKYFSCDNCCTILHIDCVGDFPHKCRFEAKSHQFIPRKIHIPTNCIGCGSTLTRFSGLVSYCLFCGSSAHDKCSKDIKTDCKGSGVSSINLADIYNYRGLARYHTSSFEEGIKDFTIAISLDPNQSPIFYANRSLCYYHLDDKKAAISDITMAIEGNFINSTLLSVRASAYQLLGMNNEAHADRLWAYKLDSSSVLDVFPYPIPRDIVGQIMLHIPYKSLRACAVTCKKWQKIVLDVFG